MARLRSLIERFLCALRLRQKDPELDEELAFHLEMETEENLRKGMSPEQAARSARIRLGVLTQVQQEYREVEGVRSLETLLQDVRFSLRRLWSRPGFSIVAVLILALAIGSATAVFTLIDGILLRPLPYPDPDQLLQLQTRRPPVPLVPIRIRDYGLWPPPLRSMQGVACFRPDACNLTGVERPERVFGARVSSNFFQVLGVKPFLGRIWDGEEEKRGGVAIITDGLWKESLGADPAVLGKTLHLDGHLYHVVGVMPAGFQYPLGKVNRFFIPLRAADSDLPVDFPMMIGRLSPGTDAQAAVQELNLEWERVRKRDRWDRFLDRYKPISLVPLFEQTVSEARKHLYLLGSAALTLLVLSCFTLANVLVCDGLRRQQELAVRTALGATRARLARLLLVESLALCTIGGLVGLAPAYLGSLFLRYFLGSSLPRLDEPTAPWRFILCLILVLVLTALLSALLPALRGSRVDVNETIKESAGPVTGSKRSRLVAATLVFAQVGLTVVLVIGAGLLVKSYWTLTRFRLGFDPKGVLTATTYFTNQSDAEKVRLTRRLLEEVRQLPGVRSAGTCDIIPFFWEYDSSIGRYGVERGGDFQETDVDARLRRVDGDFFRILRIPVLAGRLFDGRDTRTSPSAVIVDESLGRRLWPGENPVGRRLKLEDKIGTVVGMVGSTRKHGPRSEENPTIYLAADQRPGALVSIVAKIETPAQGLAVALLQRWKAVEPEQPLYKVEPLSSAYQAALAEDRANALLITIFGLWALSLACLGLYGLLAYRLSTRVHEIAIKMALGAERRRILFQTSRQGLVLLLLGLIAGNSVAIAFTRLLSSLLFQVDPLDPGTVVMVNLILVGASLLACWLPAWRAARLSPAQALRYQ